MTALALALALAAQQPQAPPPSWYHAWRLVDMPSLHVGARPAAFVDDEGVRGRVEYGTGVTVQVSAFVF